MLRAVLSLHARRKGEAHVVLLSAKEVAALTQQRAESGSFGRLVMADVSGGEEKVQCWECVAGRLHHSPAV